jgi:regulator of sirC expression with transglutaminase-like and TPR domain
MELESPPPTGKYAKRTWTQITTDAESARRLTVTDRERGMQKFAELLKTHPNEPMIVFKRGQALAELGDREGAKRDFAVAAAQFPMEKWKRIAEDAARRVEQEERSR